MADHQTPPWFRFIRETLHTELLNILLVAANEFQRRLVEFLAQSSWCLRDHTLIGRFQVWNPPCGKWNPCLTVQMQPEGLLLVKRDGLFLREEPDP